MSKSNSVRKSVIDNKRQRASYHQPLRYRPAAPFALNVKGMRYVRDEGKSGIVSKLVPR